MEANQTEVEKLDLIHLPLELRRQLLEAMTEQLQVATDPLDVQALLVGIENLKKSLD